MAVTWLNNSTVSVGAYSLERLQELARSIKPVPKIAVVCTPCGLELLKRDIPITEADAPKGMVFPALFGVPIHQYDSLAACLFRASELTHDGWQVFVIDSRVYAPGEWGDASVADVPMIVE